MSAVFRLDRTPTRTGSLSGFRWTYYRAYTASEAAFRIHADGGELDRLRVYQAYKKRKEEGLWWFAGTFSTVSQRGFIRHHYAKVLRQEFEEKFRKTFA